MDERDSYWEPRVMRHHYEDGSEEYAIHEVYFDGNGNVKRYTQDALSPRGPSLDELRDSLVCLIEENAEEVTAGDLGYFYHRTYIEEWIRCLDDPVVDYDLCPET